MAVTGVQPTKFQQFRKTKAAVWFGMVLTGLLSFFLLVYTSNLFCLMPALIALLCYFIPWYFGLKDRKKLAIFGFVLFIILGLAIGALTYSIIADSTQPNLSSSNGQLTGGTFVPFRGNGAATYDFNVTLRTGTNSSVVYVIVYDSWTGVTSRYNMTCDIATRNTTGPYNYTVTKQLSNSVFQSAFFYEPDSSTKVYTSAAIGPIGPSNNDILARELWFEVFVVFLNIGLLFYIILMLTWWMDSNKKKFEAMQKQRMEEQGKPTIEGKGTVKTEKFVCSACGSEVPSDAKECPQCGEKFDE